ncbi:MAG: malto-oligosyltrehalose trehalohydrolase [Candidatus Sumerlaeaceae bacterium]
MNPHWNEAEARRLKHRLGATCLGDGGCLFRVWTPGKTSVSVHLVHPVESIHPMAPCEFGYWEATITGVSAGTRYLFQIDGKVDRPDPASRSQPDDVHKASEVIADRFHWEDQHWFGTPLSRYVIYELHVGTYTPEGTFEAIIPHLQMLKELGITAIELMPVAQFPGTRNWGYDGVYPYAVQNSYGGHTGLKKLVNAAHNQGIAVLLDVVFNHLGPEGNYLGEYAPYFTERYKTPWGQAINYDGPHSEEVRRFFVNAACEWIEEYHIDGLRLDATHFIFDMSANPFLLHLAQRIKQTADGVNRRAYLFAETDTNDSRWIRPDTIGGFEMNAQWNDDFHHALYTLLPNADAGAYTNDFGRFSQLVKAFSDGYVYTGEYSNFRKRRHGNPSADIHGKRFVVFAQNHDQVGNRPKGERMCAQVSYEGTKLAAGSVLLAPYLPMLFMGEEHAETAPFLYFVHHGDPGLIEAVRNGRKEEFAHFMTDVEPADPQDPQTMELSRVDHRLRAAGRHKLLWELHRELLRLRREVAPLADLSKEHLRVHSFDDERVIALYRTDGEDEAIVLLCYKSSSVSIDLPLRQGRYVKIFDSADQQWMGPGTSAPQQVDLEGETTRMKLPAESVTVYLRL